VGETVDGVATVVDSKTHAQNAEEKRVTDFIAKAKDKKQLQEVEPLISNDSQYQLFNQKMTELDGKV
jgi:hypothetical protein